MMYSVSSCRSRFPWSTWLSQGGRPVSGGTPYLICQPVFARLFSPTDLTRWGV